MEMPIMPGLEDGPAAAPNALADLLGSLSDDDVTALVSAASSMPPTDADTPDDNEPEDLNQEVGDPDAPADPNAPPAADEDPEAAAEAKAAADQATAQQYCDTVDGAVSSIADLKSRIEALSEGADEHKKQGIDTGPVDDAVDAVAEAESTISDASDAADAAMKGDEPDLEAGAQAAQDATDALQSAQTAVTAAETALRSDIADADDPDLAAMRAWADSMGLSSNGGSTDSMG